MRTPSKSALALSVLALASQAEPTPTTQTSGSSKITMIALSECTLPTHTASPTVAHHLRCDELLRCMLM